MAIYCIVCEI